LEKEGCNDEKLLTELRKERDKLLNELNLNWFDIFHFRTEIIK
jgi:hypothetical protein